LGGGNESIPTPLDATVRGNKECSRKCEDAIAKDYACVVVAQDGYVIKLPVISEVEKRTGGEPFAAG
jgi:hypothetical protein